MATSSSSLRASASSSSKFLASRKVFSSSSFFHGCQRHHGNRFITSFPSLHASSQSSSSCLSIKCAVRFRPCIDIHKGKVKQIVGSTLRDSKEEDGSALVTNFESDKSAAEFANLYKEDGLMGGHVIMLGADDLSKAAAVEALRAYPGGLQVGGGINVNNALNYIEEGASHVIVTSDGRYAIVTDRWQKFSDVYLEEEVLEFLANYADEFLVHGVDVEGKRLGIDEELVALLGRHSPIPVTYAGGVTTMIDLERIKVAGDGCVDLTVGSALDIFGGNLPYKDVVAWHTRQETLMV
ncbi:1-(5-phosphoribosyl)-5-[(5-phosphoribosylamino)methylideneamino] imidazole-4-carboxamide isomerase, chloroplastic isoform X3 [Populus alba]|uniref:1-(5-phosphoribosyl)-5-[(5- phosphoribosylamino)methylideneamino] imidazole-4-carboxamide isomerase, chloroplastic isoform X3 n=1 Tax=Populus alba TaxID=43335 RepID=UPI0015895BA1|nr:1-(5-phosphoribosyl)-5-[(5-phosphoribosylamino)methylideneamino] imidazole-4-carboxamide isomerase, chloroplastic-like isoform X3 [Populus alba]